MSIQKQLTEFLEYLEIEKGRSKKTVENYRRYIEHFTQTMGVSDTNQITEDILRSYRLKLNRKPKQAVSISDSETIKKRTQNYYLIAIRMFLKYAVKRGFTTQTHDVIELAKVGERQIEIMTTDELLRLLDAPETSTIRGKRDKAILELLFSTGLRVSELVSLNKDIDLSRNETSIRGKGEKLRVVFISDRAKISLQEYLESRNDDSEPLFIEHSPRTEGKDNHKRLTPRTVERIVKHYANVSGVGKKTTPHALRHAFATNLLQNGADIRSVQIMLGHANITTTQVYTHVTDTQLQKIHSRYHKRPEGI